MDFSYYKYLYYVKDLDKFSYNNLCTKFNISRNDARNILQTLSNNGYIQHYQDIEYKVTFKGKHFVKSLLSKWLFTNLLAIIAIIISIIALFK